LVDNRAAGFYGMSGAFRGSDAQSASLSREKYGNGAEYFAADYQEEQEEIKESPFVDRGGLLTATLNSLAMFNIANIIKGKTLSRSREEELNK
jgi:hypothetical protein